MFCGIVTFAQTKVLSTNSKIINSESIKTYIVNSDLAFDIKSQTKTLCSQQLESLVFQKRHVYSGNKKLDKEELKKLLTSTPESTFEYDKYKTKKTIGTVAIYLSLSAAIYAGATSISNSNKDGKNLSEGNLQTSDQTNLIGPAVAVIGFSTIGALFILNSQDHLIKAVKLFNSNNKTDYNSYSKLEMEFAGTGIAIRYHF
jgi:hypothetical protein